jgi:putative ABC transport system permease protein
METIAADLRHALRVLWKSPGFTLVAVAALAFGIGANTAIFSVVNAVLLSPLPYPDAERMVQVQRGFPNGSGNSQSIPKFFNARRNDLFEAMAAYDFEGPGLNLSGGDRPERVKAIHASADFFRVFGVAPALGRGFVADEDRPGGQRVAVLSDGLWHSHFAADRQIVGRSILLNGEPYVVVGIMPARFQADPPADAWIPLQADPNSANQGHFLMVAGRLKPGVTIQAAQERMKPLGDSFREANPKWMNKTESIKLVPMRDAMVGDVRPALLILSSAVLFVLLIACANVANLLLARAAGRQKEIAIRSAMGAGRMRIVRQLLTESVLLAGCGGVLGLAIGVWGVRLLLTFSPGNIPRVTSLTDSSAFALALDWRILAFTVAISFATGILFGLFPALRISRTDLSSTLKENSGRGATGMRHNRARGLLVVAEMALALVLLIGAGLLIRTFAGLRNVNPGIDIHNVITMQTSMAGSRYDSTAKVENFTTQVLRRVESLPGVEAAASTIVLPTAGEIDLPLNVEGHPPANGDTYNGDEQWRMVTPHYFAAFKIPLLRGRVFNDSETSRSLPVVIISEGMARKYWPKEDALGRRIIIGKGLGPEFEEPARMVVGIVGDVRQVGLDQPMQPTMYVPVSQVTDGLTRLGNGVLATNWVVRTAMDPASLVIAVQREFLAVDSQLPVSKVRTMRAVVAETIARQNFNMLLLTILAGIALLLAAIGIYGLMSYAVEQRTHEIGIRLALGAGRSDMARMVVSQGMRLAGIGLIVGLGGAFGLTRYLSKLLFEVKPTDPGTFAGVTLVLAAVALLASYIPARRATRVDPIIALRYE